MRWTLGATAGGGEGEARERSGQGQGVRGFEQSNTLALERRRRRRRRRRRTCVKSEASDNARDKEGYQHAPKHDKAQTGRGRCKGEEEEDIGESLGSRPRATDSRRERERESLSHKACRAVEALRAVVAI